MLVGRDEIGNSGFSRSLGILGFGMYSVLCSLFVLVGMSRSAVAWMYYVVVDVIKDIYLLVI